MRNIFLKKPEGKKDYVRLQIKSDAGSQATLRCNGGGTSMDFKNSGALHISYAGHTVYIDASMLETDGLIVKKWKGEV